MTRLPAPRHRACAGPNTGGATPLAVLVGLGLCLLVAVTIGQMAKHLPSAGGLYTYNARGLGTGFGGLIAWATIPPRGPGRWRRGPGSGRWQ